jgi:hypothetical protein
MKLITDIKLLLLGLWLGATCFFIAVAQIVFAVLPTRELAGLVVGRSLAVLNFSAIAVAVLVIVLSFLGAGRVNKFLLWAERLLLLVVAAAGAIGQFVIGFWLSSLRVQMGRPIDEIAADDPLKVQFNSLHEYSVWVLFAGMAAALLAFFIVSNRKSGKEKDKKAEVYDFSREFKV